MTKIDDTFNTLKYGKVRYKIDWSDIAPRQYVSCALGLIKIWSKYEIDYDTTFEFWGYRNEDWAEALKEIKELRFESTTEFGATPFIISLAE